MTLIDLFRNFSQTAIENNFPASVRILYYTVLYEWNELRRPNTFTIRKTVLLAKTGLPESTFRDAYRFLTSRKLFVSKTTKRGVYVIQLQDKEETSATSQALNAPARQSVEKIVPAEENPPQGFSSSQLLEDRANEHGEYQTPSNGIRQESRSRTFFIS